MINRLLNALADFGAKRAARSRRRDERAAYASMTWAQLHHWLNQARWEMAEPSQMYPDWFGIHASRAGMIRSELQRRRTRRVPA